MTASETINRAREQLDAALSIMRRTWVDRDASDDDLCDAQERARHASELIADLRKALARKNTAD